MQSPPFPFSTPCPHKPQPLKHWRFSNSPSEPAKPHEHLKRMTSSGSIMVATCIYNPRKCQTMTTTPAITHVPLQSPALSGGLLAGHVMSCEELLGIRHEPCSEQNPGQDAGSCNRWGFVMAACVAATRFAATIGRCQRFLTSRVSTIIDSLRQFVAPNFGSDTRGEPPPDVASGVRDQYDGLVRQSAAAILTHACVPCMRYRRLVPEVHDAVPELQKH